MVTIFVSYSHDDADGFARAIVKAYEKVGCKVTLAKEGGVEYGMQWTEEIPYLISDCDIFIVLITGRALLSSIVGQEVEQAVELGKRIIPCKHRGVSDTEFFQLGLNIYQGVTEFTDKDELIRELDRLLKGSEEDPYEPPEDIDDEQPEEEDTDDVQPEDIDDEQPEEEDTDDVQPEEEEPDYVPVYEVVSAGPQEEEPDYVDDEEDE